MTFMRLTWILTDNGKVRFRFLFRTGHPLLKINACDAVNKSSERIPDPYVVIDEELVINHVLNYPNPFTTRSQFWLEHNRPGQDLFVQILIYSLTGMLIKALAKTINTEGNRSSELERYVKDEYCNRVARRSLQLPHHNTITRIQTQNDH